MSERRKQSDFLKSLLRYMSEEQQRALDQRFAKAEREEKCVRRALFLVTLVALFALCGAGYSAVFLPGFIREPWNPVTRQFCALGLCAGICIVAFLAFRAWQRSVTSSLHEECRRQVRALMENSFSPQSSPDLRHSAGPHLKVCHSSSLPQGI